MGRSSGTGQPLFFQCSQCRARKGASRLPYRDDARNGWRGSVQSVRLTGRTRSKSDGNSYGRSDMVEREYVCLDCGHTGWSRHTDLKRASVRRAQ